MAWCPKCKNEYIEGITKCSDCNTDLVDEIVEEKELEYLNISSVMGTIKDIDDVIDYLHQASIDSAEYVYLEDENMEAICVDKKQYSDARLHLSVYLQNESTKEFLQAAAANKNNTETSDNIEAENSASEDLTDDVIISKGSIASSHLENDEIVGETDNLEDSDPILSSNQKSYTKLSDKYEDVKSSAYTLLIVGVVGGITILLEAFGIFTIPISSQTKWLFYTVMGGIFIAFIISGIFSMMHAQQLKIDACKEDETINEILSWFHENHTGESIDAEIDTDIQEELLYFNRAEYIKNIIMHEFENADEPLVDSLIESIYAKLYEA